MATRASISTAAITNLAAIIAGLPAWPSGSDWLGVIRRADRPHVFVLDDDPTGTQTVRDLPVLMSWTDEHLVGRLRRSPHGMTFISTNSRALPEAAAVSLAETIGSQIDRASRETGVPVSAISRSDSTLRGHFPSEVDGLIRGLGRPDARIALAPYFGEAGRITVNDVHLIREHDGSRLTPVASTEFARDRVFGFRNSDLRAWVRERGGGQRITSSVAIGDLRRDGPVAVVRALEATPPGGVCVINAVEDLDIEAAVVGIGEAQRRGLPVVIRSASSLVRAMAAQPCWPPLTSIAGLVRGLPGLVVVGSHTALTTTQLDRLLEDRLLEDRRPTMRIDLPSSASTANKAVLSARIDRCLEEGVTPLLVSPRAVIPSVDATDAIRVSGGVSDQLVDVVSRLRVRPAWVLTKGGITSHEIVAKAMDVREATVLGQLIPGVPVWRAGADSRWPGIVIVIFPGNVGEAGSLATAVAGIQAAAEHTQ